MRKVLTTSVLLLVLVAAAGFHAAASQSRSASQSRYTQENDPRLGERKDVSDKFTFVRLRYGPMSAGEWLGDGGIPWSHDYPEAGIHFSKILSEVSKVSVNLDMEEYIFSFTDPNLFKYPFAYLCEIGPMQLTDEELSGMREYLLRGGFILVDDFRGQWQMRNLADHIKRALPEPEYQLKQLDVSHPVFNCFFSIKSLEVRPPYDRLRPEFWGVEDKNGRLMMVINYNNDVSDYWQWSNDPFQPIEDTNSAYKFGVNYVLYALTH